MPANRRSPVEEPAVDTPLPEQPVVIDVPALVPDPIPSNDPPGTIREVPAGRWQPKQVSTVTTLGVTIKQPNRSKRIQFINGLYTCRTEEEYRLCRKALGGDLYDEAPGAKVYGPSPKRGFRSTNLEAYNACLEIEVRTS